MKRFSLIVFLVLTICATSLGCAGTSASESTGKRRETSVCTIDPTCSSEGYTEHTYSDGYVCRDTFTPKTDHEYLEFTYGSEKNLKREICRFCGREKLTYTETEINTDVTVDPDRERPSFAGLDVMACAMILEPTANDAIKAIRTADMHGAYGFMVYVSCLEPQYRTLSELQRVMHCTDKPVLAIAYNNSTFFPQNLSAEDMADLLRLSVQAGAAAVDMQGYLFGDYAQMPVDLKANRAYWEECGFDMSFVSASPKEVCGDPVVLGKQKSFIDGIHGMGAEVLVSVHAGTEMDAAQIVALNEFIKAQNADIVKLVLSGSSKETVIEHLKACIELEKRQAAGEFDCKFSVHGQSTLSRLMCPMFGSYIAFCVDRYTEVETNIQIELDTMLAILNSPELKGAK